MKIRFLIIGFVLLMVAACDEPIYNITIENKSGYDIYCYPSNLYPDTFLTSVSVSRMTAKNVYLVLTYETKEIEAIAYCDKEIWETYVNKDTLIIFVFKKEIIQENAFDTVIKYDLIHRKLFITYQQLTDNGCVVRVD